MLHRSLALDVGAEDVFDALYKDSEHSFWLDSSLPDSRNGRFSFMGDAAGPLARIATADVRSGQVTVRSASGTEVFDGSFFDWLDADLAAYQVAGPNLPFEFALGWVGYLGYELKAQCGGSRAHRSAHPDAAMLFTDRAIAFDHRDSAVHLLALSETGDEQQAKRWLAETAAVLSSVAAGQSPAAPVPVASDEVGPLRLRLDRRRYLELITTCQDQIAAGETYEICLTNMVTAQAELDPWNTYRLLRRENPAPFGAFLRFDTLSVLGSSPERFLRVDTDRRVESKPIKGTRPRGASSAEDELLRLELGVSEKDLAENLMIVDLVRHDLGRCAEVGSVQVAKLFDVESYATVHQLVSTVRAQLRPEVTAVECVRAAFPGGSMTGAPKIRTMQIIDDLEQGPRGIYSGALGYFSLSGAAELSMVIRTLVLSPGTVEFGVGGAIIALSDPDAELAELAVKAAPILRVLGKPCFPD
jgi:para-aminobenzoate synthetase